MDGFKLYVTNTSLTIPPENHLCYADPDDGQPNTTQTIPCNELGKYVIYYDDKGYQEEPDRYDGPVIELCYVAINGGFNSSVYRYCLNLLVWTFKSKINGKCAILK